MVHLEGRQSVVAALQARQRKFDVVLLAHGAHPETNADVLAAAEGAQVPIRYLSRDQLDAMAHGKSHGGVIAVCTNKPRTSPAQLQALLGDLSVPPLLLLLEGIDDARNLGFALRTAEAMGVHAVLIKKHLWDFDETEVARPSSGAYERLPLVQFEGVDLLQDLRHAHRIRLYGCIAGVKRTIYDTRLNQGVCMAIGGEKRGLSGAVRRICDKFVTIPSVPGAASLPLSAAAAVILGEARRQRLSPATPVDDAEPDAAAEQTGTATEQTGDAGLEDAVERSDESDE
jgi:23S rRNA (guanosine2251-2'-O)-methyltransferase